MIGKPRHAGDRVKINSNTNCDGDGTVGDGWQHSIKIERSIHPLRGVGYPRPILAAGKRSAVLTEEAPTLRLAQR